MPNRIRMFLPVFTISSLVLLRLIPPVNLEYPYELDDGQELIVALHHQNRFHFSNPMNDRRYLSNGQVQSKKECRFSDQNYKKIKMKIIGSCLPWRRCISVPWSRCFSVVYIEKWKQRSPHTRPTVVQFSQAILCVVQSTDARKYLRNVSQLPKDTCWRSRM